ncbi:MAG: 2-amino-4-hydroxy-6-hydroxymethyldihydropteridine diphosphokinase [Gemmatimonadota bacterium]
MSEIAYIALGSNLGNRAAHLSAARSALTLVSGVRLLAASRVEETAPIGSRPQGSYLNQMVALSTTNEPLVLLDALQAIERRMGRVRTQRWGPRTIDLDIVRFGARAVRTGSLVIPHPGLADRDFWQREVTELDRLVALIDS